MPQLRPHGALAHGKNVQVNQINPLVDRPEQPPTPPLACAQSCSNARCASPAMRRRRRGERVTRLLNVVSSAKDATREQSSSRHVTVRGWRPSTEGWSRSSSCRCRCRRRRRRRRPRLRRRVEFETRARNRGHRTGSGGKPLASQQRPPCLAPLEIRRHRNLPTRVP